MDQTIRERTESLERQTLSPRACLSASSRGRAVEIAPCPMRTCFQRDIDRVVHCKSFRRLKHKTQVFLQPEGDHYRTRMTHTLEVSRIARTMARGLALNEDLAEAAALAHDLGHTPFGHAGERVLNEIMSDGFRHNEQSLRVVDRLEKNGQGLNLTYEVRDGILNHQTSGTPHTLEGKIVRLSDKIAYIHHDMDDAVRAGILKESDVPREIRDVIGSTPSDRFDHFIHDIVNASMGRDDIRMSEETHLAMTRMRAFMFEHVYENPVAKSEEAKAERLMETLYLHFLHHIDSLPEEFRGLLEQGEPREQVVCDYVGAMTDRYAIAVYDDIYIPKSWMG